MKTLAAERLTPEAFAPYGQVLRGPRRAADITKEHLAYWHNLADIGFTEHPIWGFLSMKHRAPVLAELERHCFAHEVFIPLGTGVSVMPFALGGSPDVAGSTPDLKTLRLFILDGNTAVIVGRGVWHAPAFPVTPAADFLLALEERTPASDLDIQTVGPFEFDLQAVAPQEGCRKSLEATRVESNA